MPVDDFHEFAKLHMPIIANYARRRLYPLEPQELDDIVADVLVVAWRRRADIPEGAETPWIIGVTRRVLANARRKQYRRLAHQRTLRDDNDSKSAEDRVVKDATVQGALDALNEADRELLLLHYWEDLAIDQIATLLGATANATAVRVSRAKKRFSEAFQKFESS